MRRNVLVALSAMLFMALMVVASPAQGQVTVNNNTACDIIVCTARGGCITIPNGSTVVIPISCATAVRIRVCGQDVAIPPGGCLFNVPVGVGGCCADVCFNVGTCTIDVNPTPGPCRCP